MRRATLVLVAALNFIFPTATFAQGQAKSNLSQAPKQTARVDVPMPARKAQCENLMEMYDHLPPGEFKVEFKKSYDGCKRWKANGWNPPETDIPFMSADGAGGAGGAGGLIGSGISQPAMSAASGPFLEN